MRKFAMFVLVCCSAYSSDLDSKVLKVIGEDAVGIWGVNLIQFKNSTMAAVAHAEVAYEFGINQPDLFIWVEYRDSNLAIFRGNNPILNMSALQPTMDVSMPAEYKMPIFERKVEADTDRREDIMFVALDEQTATAGDPSAVDAALKRWFDNASPGKIAARIREVSASYDNWIFMNRPLRSLNKRGPDIAGTSAVQFIEMIESVEGGIRVGEMNQLQLDVTMQRHEDAQTMAGLARWAPGFLQAMPDRGRESIAVDLMEDLTVYASGTRVTIRCVLPSEKLQKLVNSRFTVE